MFFCNVSFSTDGWEIFVVINVEFLFLVLSLLLGLAVLLLFFLLVAGFLLFLFVVGLFLLLLNLLQFLFLGLLEILLLDLQALDCFVDVLNSVRGNDFNGFEGVEHFELVVQLLRLLLGFLLLLELLLLRLLLERSDFLLLVFLVNNDFEFFLLQSLNVDFLLFDLSLVVEFDCGLESLQVGEQSAADFNFFSEGVDEALGVDFGFLLLVSLLSVLFSL